MKLTPILLFSVILVVLTFSVPVSYSEEPGKVQVKQISEPYTPQPGTPERKAIMDGLRKVVKGWVGAEVIFVVKYLKVNNGWAWVHVLPQSKDGQNNYEDVSGLLQKIKDEWKLVETRSGECGDDPDCSDDKRYFKKLKLKFLPVPENIFPN